MALASYIIERSPNNQTRRSLNLSMSLLKRLKSVRVDSDSFLPNLELSQHLDFQLGYLYHKPSFVTTGGV
ncbi:MAG: hypothetical protein RMX68_017590 [Aulosira sp. ZfuVER01]|nr:hypothetical protein [Aulosira sp. ZfuVER01]MDZ7996330.1 hypothetical protein [Aulosira sp. DedVER01a]MDZ8055762.1 hypothetical protein [Aulosira sp. ZfuCHP01]